MIKFFVFILTLLCVGRPLYAASEVIHPEHAKAAIVLHQQKLSELIVDTLFPYARHYGDDFENAIKQKVQPKLENMEHLLKVPVVTHPVNLTYIPRFMTWITTLSRFQNIPLTFTAKDIEKVSREQAQKITNDNLKTFFRVFGLVWGDSGGLPFFEDEMRKSTAKHTYSYFENLVQNKGVHTNPFDEITQRMHMIIKASQKTTRFQRIDFKEQEAGIGAEEFYPPNVDYGSLIQNQRHPKSSEMIVNLMWIKREKDHDPEGLIFPKEYNRHTVEKAGAKTINILKRLDDWAEHFPKVIFWYDGSFLSEGSVERTQALLQENCNHSSKIKLMDLRTLDTFQKNQDFINSPGYLSLSPYTKSGWSRLVLSYDQALHPEKWLLENKEPFLYSLYADLSIPPFLPEAITGDPKAIFDLNTAGFLFSLPSSGHGHENNFHIISSQPEILAALKRMIIDFGPKCMTDLATGKFSYDDDDVFYYPMLRLMNMVMSEKNYLTWTHNGVTFKEALTKPDYNPYQWYFGPEGILQWHDQEIAKAYDERSPTFDAMAPKTGGHGIWAGDANAPFQ